MSRTWGQPRGVKVCFGHPLSCKQFAGRLARWRRCVSPPSAVAAFFRRRRFTISSSVGDNLCVILSVGSRRACWPFDGGELRAPSAVDRKKRCYDLGVWLTLARVLVDLRTRAALRELFLPFATPAAILGDLGVSESLLRHSHLRPAIPLRNLMFFLFF